MAVIEAVIKHRHGTAFAWTSANPVLAVGEYGREDDTGRGKWGDGVTPWNSLAYDDTVARIYDASAAGRNLLLAADVPAQRVLLDIENTDNTSDEDKPVSVAQASAIATSQAIVTGRAVAFALAI